MGVLTPAGVHELGRADEDVDAPARGRLWRRRQGDLIALGILIGIPLVFFAIPAAAGYPLLTGDNVIQNYPLRVLAGEILAHGHLPIYNPFAWGGSPLLASANATVAFPDIALFAFLPGIVAWVGVEVIAFAGAAVGLFCFLRCEGLEPLPAGIGGAIYGLGGYVSSQAIHLDVVQTAASLAWVLIGLQRVGRGTGRHLFAWTAFLAAAVAAAGLSGNPESEFYAALGATIYGISVIVSSNRRLRRAAMMALGAVVGTLVASVQVIPADRFVAVSQRAAVPFAFLTQGSVRPAELSLVLLPHLFGGGLIGLRHYVGGANLAEIDVYPGLLAIVGAVALAFSFRSPNASRIRVWYLVGAIGLFVALGPATFLPHLLRHLPVVGMSRLPSRALVLPAASFAVLGGFFAAEFLDPGSALPRRPGGRSMRLRALEKCSVLVPTFAVVGLAIAVAIGGRPLAESIAGRALRSWTLAAVAPYLGVACALALVVGVVLVGGARLSRHGRAVALVGIVAIDLLLFMVNQTSLAPIRSKDAGRPNRYEKALRRVVGANSRFIVVDPGRVGGFVLDDLGAPNLNVFYDIPSAQGYGSLTWGPYADLTGTHAQDTASPSAFATPVFDSLDVRALLALPSSFERAADRRDSDVIRVRSSVSTTRYFGAFVDVRSICVGEGATPTRSISRFVSRLRFIDGGASTGMRFTDAKCGVKAQWVRSVRAAGVVFPAAPRGVTSIDATVTTMKNRTFALDGALSASVTAPHWIADGRIGPYFVFRDTSAKAPFTAVTPDHDRSVRIMTRVIASSPWTPTETVAVTSPQKAQLVRDVSAIPGWNATVEHDGKTTTVAPMRDGVVQAVTIPRGSSVVTYRYDPPGLSLGEGLAAAGVVAVLALIALDRRPGRAARGPAGEELPPTRGGQDGTGDPKD